MLIATAVVGAGPPVPESLLEGVAPGLDVVFDAIMAVSMSVDCGMAPKVLRISWASLAEVIEKIYVNGYDPVRLHSLESRL